MTAAQTLIIKCPICKHAVAWIAEEHFKPFCSERCKLIDLGDWATEAHKIPCATVDNLYTDDSIDQQ